ncbi:outer membrane beta-barrel protein [Ketobacter alkanivorans]|uniref:Outer membrane protein beta-barrel domain-containing protein n=1 Tax=Ketobacter alkanivorans TaxID=1917421 RepID=A0A2K9LFQ5_9GAMM|nr:outer membrane beta-barrel protein [Ketobacter alkanivorans]AUM11189.1 hypothetical protein Kalk_01535 [Ketobacter alkanivorans]
MNQMFKLYCAALLMACWSGTALAESSEGQVVSGFGKLGFDWVDVSSADFDGSLTLEAGLRLQLENNLSLEVALTGINDSQTDVVEDNTGSYQLTINSLDLLFGGAYRFDIQPHISAYVRGGGLAYSMEVEIEEGFYDLKPSGTDSADDRGYGFYAGLGGEFRLRSDFSLLAEFLYKSRKDFLSSSSRPFDVTSYGLSVGILHQF